MIEPSKLKEEFNKVEDENYAFRAYLKNHADIDKLDEQFLKLHNELFVNYDCNKCRNCCKEYSASCKGYPFTDRSERLFSLISIIESTSVCPVVFEMIERLKKEYNFTRKRR